MQFRNTKQKEMVYDLISKYGHLSTDQIRKHLLDENEDISRATIYRNLTILTLENKIKLVKVGNIDVYETIKDNHYHFICKCCSKVEDIDPRLITFQLDESLVEIQQIDVVLHGICGDCQERKKEGETNLWNLKDQKLN